MDDNKKSDKFSNQKDDYLQEIISEVNKDGHKVHDEEQSQKSSKFTTPVKIAAITLILILLIVLRIFLSQMTDSKFSERQLFQEALENPMISHSTTEDKILKKETIEIEKQIQQESEQDDSNDSENQVCKKAALLFSNKKLVMSKYSPQLRFRNIHKKVDGTIYRLRFFYKDGDNGDIPTYLVYKEDSSENEFIVENTSKIKGKLYQKIEKANGEILYDSEAFELQGKNDLFIRYENEEIKELQGFLDIEAQERFPLDCIY